MRNLLVTAALSAALWSAGLLGPAEADRYVYTFETFDGSITMSGTISVGADDMIVGMTGTISGAVSETISGVTVNPSFPTEVVSPDGAFLYDNLYIHSDPVLDLGGVLFTTLQNTTGYWNLWGTGPGAYALYESMKVGSSFGYTVEETGNFTTFYDAPAPIPSQGAPTLVVLAAMLAHVARRQQARRRAARR